MSVKNINSQSKKEMKIFIWVNLRIISWETSLSESSENCFEEISEKAGISIYVVLAKRVHTIKHSSREKLAASH